MQIVIRKMVSDDMEAAVRVLSQWNMAPVTPTADVPDPERSSIDVENSFVAVEEDRVVGVCSYIMHSPEFAETASFAVDPAYVGKGIGYRLHTARLKEMREKGIRKVRTETDRPETIRWYVEKFGYRVTGKNKKKHPFSLPDTDHWTVLELDLEQ